MVLKFHLGLILDYQEIYSTKESSLKKYIYSGISHSHTFQHTNLAFDTQSADL